MKLTNIFAAFAIATTAVIAAPGTPVQRSPDKAQPAAAAWTTPCDPRGGPHGNSIPQAHVDGWPPVCGSPNPDQTCTSFHNRTCTYEPDNYEPGAKHCTYVGCVEMWNPWAMCNQCIAYEKECLLDGFTSDECKNLICGDGQGVPEKVREETKQCRGPELDHYKGGMCKQFCEKHP